jgi:hypothetical protein
MPRKDTKAELVRGIRRLVEHHWRAMEQKRSTIEVLAACLRGAPTATKVGTLCAGLTCLDLHLLKFFHGELRSRLSPPKRGRRQADVSATEFSFWSKVTDEMWRGVRSERQACMNIASRSVQTAEEIDAFRKKFRDIDKRLGNLSRRVSRRP